MKRPELSINGKAYQLVLAPPSKCMGLATRVILLLGSIIPTLGKDIKKGGWGAFASALSGADPDKIEALFVDAVTINKLHCDNEEVFTETGFDKHFDKYRNELFQVRAWALWESVRDFLPQGVASAIQKQSSALTEEFKSPETGQANTG